MMPGEPEEIYMNDLPDNLRAELATRVESRLMGVQVLSLLKMMLLKSDEKEEGGDKPKLLKENDQDAKEAVVEIIDKVSQTVRTGRLPDKEAA
jgi:hypothetical protein